MNLWLLIVLAAAGSYLLRALPLLMRQRLSNAPVPVTCFLEHAAAAVTGMIICSALLGEHAYDSTLAYLAEPATLIRLGIVVMAAVLAAWTRRIFLTLVICLGVMHLIAMWTGG